MIKATFNALNNCMSPRAVAARRGKKVSEIVARRSDVGGAERARA
jgi:small subunit ribosomal protein S5